MKKKKINKDKIHPMEKILCPEWFQKGKALHHRSKHKTPERYMKIRNYILDQWEQKKPIYITKLSIRPGLKGEGDVNAIGRIHEFLEKYEFINKNAIENPLSKAKRIRYQEEKRQKKQEEEEEEEVIETEVDKESGEDHGDGEVEVIPTDFETNITGKRKRKQTVFYDDSKKKIILYFLFYH